MATKAKKPSVTPHQILGAEIRAEVERFEKKIRRRCAGGWELPANYRTRRDAHIAKMFSIAPSAVQFFMTWSRACTHPWSAGACPLCPD